MSDAANRASLGASPRRRLTWAAWLVAVGLAVEAVSLLWSHPTAFLLFLLPGAVLVAVGVLAFLWQVATQPAVTPAAE